MVTLKNMTRRKIFIKKKEIHIEKMLSVVLSLIGVFSIGIFVGTSVNNTKNPCTANINTEMEYTYEVKEETKTKLTSMGTYYVDKNSPALQTLMPEIPQAVENSNKVMLLEITQPMYYNTASKIENTIRQVYKIYRPETANAYVKDYEASDTDFYIPAIVLDYDWETLYMDYDLQKFIYYLCLDNDIDYYLVMGMIARESRFDTTVVSCTAGRYYYGLMQMDNTCVQQVMEWEDNADLDPTNPYDNVYIGIKMLKHQMDKTGSEHGGLMAYGTGYQGYLDNINNGIYYNSDTTKAYKFRDILKKLPKGTYEKNTNITIKDE